MNNLVFKSANDILFLLHNGKISSKEVLTAFLEQKDAIENAFNTWKGKNEQTDDVCIIGVRI